MMNKLDFFVFLQPENKTEIFKIRKFYYVSNT